MWYFLTLCRDSQSKALRGTPFLPLSLLFLLSFSFTLELLCSCLELNRFVVYFSFVIFRTDVKMLLLYVGCKSTELIEVILEPDCNGQWVVCEFDGMEQ